MPESYFSDREGGPPARVRLEIDVNAWGGFVALVDGLVANGAFGVDFPEACPDGRGPTGTDSHALGLAIRADIPQIEWPLRAEIVPPTLAALDLLEFCHTHVAEPTPVGYHSFFGHNHLSFDRDAGRRQFQERVNRVLARNQIAYELRDDGMVVRLAAPVLGEALSIQAFRTGDRGLDELLEAARDKFLNPAAKVRREALEKLWAAWERLKTLEPGKDKKASAQALLDKAADEETFRQLLDDEANALTKVGNTFHIRHSEISQIELRTEDHVDYLFHRMFALIWLLLRAR